MVNFKIVHEIMKKTYIAPVAKVYNVNVANSMLLTQSLSITDEPAKKEYDGGGDVKGFTSPSNVWDVEW